MNTIIEILMDRDCFSYEEAKCEFEFAKKAFEHHDQRKNMEVKQ